jgi:hypothetical protein
MLSRSYMPICQPRRRSILDSLGLQRVLTRTNLAFRMNLFGGLFQKTEWNVFFNHMVGKKNRWTNINLLSQLNHIWQAPEKNWTGHQDTLESERIQNRPRPWLTIGLGNRLSGVYMQNSTNTAITVNQGHNSWWGSTRLMHSIRLFFRNQGNRQ